MRKPLFIILCFVCCGTTASVASFLKSTSFPKTFNDLTFNQRVAVLTEGYEPFETVYDANGNCIENCPYEGFTLAQDMAQTAQAEQEAAQKLQELTQRQPVASAPTAPGVAAPAVNTQSVPAPVNPQYTPSAVSAPVPVNTPSTPGVSNVGIPSTQTGTRTCSDFRPDSPVSVDGPRGEPLAGCAKVTSPFGPRKAPKKGASTNHKGVDLALRMGQPVYATGDGVVMIAETNPNKNPCGLYVKIHHPNDMISVYCHLSQVSVRQGDKVQSGCLIGKGGSTGVSTGPHLHYSVRTKDDVAINPVTWMTCPGRV